MEERNGRRSRGPSPNTRSYLSESSDDGLWSSDSESGMRVGPEFQVHVPEWEYDPEVKPDSRAEAMLVWSPSPYGNDNEVDGYLKMAKEQFGYNIEQALGMLFWHKHDIDLALKDLQNFTPFPSDWTPEDQTLFEQAFVFHGKCFTRIRQMLPEKTTAQLVKYYYLWKKTCARVSTMDKCAKKLATLGESDEVDSHESDGEHVESATDTKKTSKPGPACKKYDAPRAKKMKRKLPKGMHMDKDELEELALKQSKFADEKIKELDNQLVDIKREIQANKQKMSLSKAELTKLMSNDTNRPAPAQHRVAAKWSNEEILLAVQGIRTYGKDFKSIAEVIGNKTDAHVRSFFITYRRKFNLDQVLANYEKENGIQHSVADDKDDEFTRENYQKNESDATLKVNSGDVMEVDDDADDEDDAENTQSSESNQGEKMNGKV